MKWLALFLLLCSFVVAPIVYVPFGQPRDIAQGRILGVTSMDAGDIDGDDLADVVVIEGGKHAGGRRAFSWFKAPADPRDDWTRFEINSGASLRSFLGAARLADMDRDGDLDLVVSSDNHSGDVKEADVFIFINPRPERRASDPWIEHKINEATLPLHHINDMAIADMDADGRQDVVVRSLEPNEIHVFFQDDTLTFTRKSIDTHFERSEGLALGRIDDDEFPDIIFTGMWLQSPANPRIENYSRRSIDAAYHLVNQNTKEAVGDIDGDGRLDVVIGPAESFRNGGPYDLAWYRNPGTDFDVDWPKTVLEANVNDYHTVKLGDFDRDGDLDVLVGVPWGDMRVQIYYNDGNGVFDNMQIVHRGKGLYSGAIADIDFDGDLDILGQDTYADSSKPWIYENLMDEK